MNIKQDRKNKKNDFDEHKILDKKEIGKLFKKFRVNIDKDQYKLASELNIVQSLISNIERGKCYPNLKLLYYLNKKYELNINWLFSGKGEMFIREEWEIIVTDPKYIELFKLMQDPVVELHILAKFEELKIILKDNIKNYMKNENEK